MSTSREALAQDRLRSIEVNAVDEAYSAEVRNLFSVLVANTIHPPEGDSPRERFGIGLAKIRRAREEALRELGWKEQNP